MPAWGTWNCVRITNVELKPNNMLKPELVEPGKGGLEWQT